MTVQPFNLADRRSEPLAARLLESPELTTGIRLLARLARIAEQTCQATGISLPQYRLLVAVSGGPQRASELAASVGVSRPTLTSLVDGLEDNGLLRRVPVPSDRRGIRLETTEAGKQAMALAERALAQRLVCLIDPDAVATVQTARDLIVSVGAALDREHQRS
jgi:MarR family transcriptional regulator for hemolysin